MVLIEDSLRTHLAAREAVQGRVLRGARGALRLQEDWSDLRSSWETTSRIADLVDSGVRQEAAVTQSYMGNAYRELGVSPKEPALTLDRSIRTGTTTPLTYRRLGADMRWHLNQDIPYDVALNMVFTRLEEMVSDDLTLAMREQSRRFFMANSRTTLGYRRVIRPEMSTEGTCGLCMVASDRRYSRSDLLPIHNRCRCDVLPVTRDYDPKVLNDVDLEAIYEAAGSNRAQDLINVKIQTVEHGELGTRIIPAGNPGNAEYKGYLRNQVAPREQKFQEVLVASEKNILDIEARLASDTARSNDRAMLQQERGQAEEARSFLRQVATGRQAIAERRRAA